MKFQATYNPIEAPPTPEERDAMTEEALSGKLNNPPPSPPKPDDCPLGICEILTIILVLGKLFGLCNLTWMQALAPLWLPWAILLWFALLAGVIKLVGSRALGWTLCVLLTVLIFLEFS